MTEERFIVGLDIGTTKICTVIGEVAGDGVLDIIGEGTVPSDGLRRGVVVNLERTIHSVRQSIDVAKRVAGVEVASVWIGVAGTHLKAFTSHGMAAIRRGADISASDVTRCIENAQAVPIDPTMDILHVLPQEYVVDGNDGIKDPIGMAGVRLEVDVHVVAGAQGPLANLRRCAEDAGVTIEGMVVQSLASGIAVLNRSEREVSAIVIDIGGGTTDVGVFRRGTLAHSAVIPLGGDHVTQDISQLLRIAPDEAERVKLQYGVAVPDLAQRDLVLEIANANYTASISTFELAQVIKPRVIEILDLVRARIEERLGALELAATHVVITGGASLMPGVDRLASERYRLPVRIGRPEGVAGLSDAVATPAHATAVGLVRFGMQVGRVAASSPTVPRVESRTGLIAGLRRMLKDFF